MRILLSLIGIVGSFFLLKYRQQVGDAMGEAEWMRHVGGIYNAIIIIALLIFFWSIAELTGTTDILFGWLRFLIPIQQPLEPQV